jgi:protoheme ferro-lyase
MRLQNKRVIIVPIAFTIDNSETDFELSIEYAEVAHESSVMKRIVYADVRMIIRFLSKRSKSSMRK